MRPTWNEYFMMMAKLASTRSTCNSRPTGCVMVRDHDILSTGYNGSMAGAPHCSDGPDIDGKAYCHRRVIKAPEGDKYNFCRSVHAEANAVARAAKLGVSLAGATCYTTLAPCYVCLKLMANAGIKRIVYELDYESKCPERDQYWKDVIKESPIKYIQKMDVFAATIEDAVVALRLPTSIRRMG